jgi:hypothetical protein
MKWTTCSNRRQIAVHHTPRQQRRKKMRSATAAIAAIAAMMLFSACLPVAPSQKTGPWTLFYDEKSELHGYRDAGGDIQIPPKFIMAGGHEFHNIVAVVEQTGEERFLDYYLTKTGEKVGIGSVYLWDNSPDCESEGKIRFRDAETDKVGFFDGRGRVVIPAAYSDARPFRNDLAVVLKDAQKVCPDNTPWSAENGACEHWRWQGGRVLLIDPRNRVVIENFPHAGGLDWFSLRFFKTADPDPLRDVFKATDGRYWSFVNFEKEFARWFEHELIVSHTPEALGRCAFDKTHTGTRMPENGSRSRKTGSWKRPETGCFK